jgi:hypothetical protein
MINLILFIPFLIIINLIFILSSIIVFLQFLYYLLKECLK